MNKIIITKKDLDENNFYKQDSIGECLNPADTHVEIDEGLDWVWFKKGIYITGCLEVKAGSGIKTDWGIEAGSYM